MNTTDQPTYTIAAKKLGNLNAPDFCARCHQLRVQLRWKVPFDVFPGVFSLLDIAEKRWVTAYLDEHGCLPDCLSELGDVVGYINCPKFTKFFFNSTEHDVRVHGEADLILVRRDGKLVIVDLKTALANPNDPLRPKYEVQACAYARAAEAQGMGKVAALALVYLAPSFDWESMKQKKTVDQRGSQFPSRLP